MIAIFTCKSLLFAQQYVLQTVLQFVFQYDEPFFGLQR